MTADRSKAYDRLAASIRRLAANESSIALLGSQPGESIADKTTRLAALPPRAAALFQELDRTAPLERSPEDGVWETLIIETNAGNAWIGVVNAIGARDRVTTFGTSPFFGLPFDLWCQCREQSLPGETPWDEARKERRVVDYKGEPTVIDRGANYITDVITAAGCQVLYTCEGHPHAAYAGFQGESQARLGEEFQKAGWDVEEDRGRVTVRMPEVDSVAERDALWRKLSLELSAVPAAAARP